MTSLSTTFADLAPTPRMPTVFVGHGSPMNAIEDTTYSRGWRKLGDSLPAPKAILVVSAHWMTRGTTLVHVKDQPRTIYDFGGFPPELYAQKYAAPGAPDVAAATMDLMRNHHVEADEKWGLDHGAWSVLIQMFPEAQFPVFQLSIDLTQSPAQHFALAKDLKALRERGVLILASGNLVHNLYAMSWDGKPYDWAVEFDSRLSDFIAKGDYQSVVDAPRLGRLMQYAHPSIEHFLPILYPLAVADKADTLSFFNEGIDLGSVSMKSFILS
ncbi:4,5-DOPA dioxygenase extradiol [Oryzibacter oryziterrae]|uniref:4,5-DOPA-extradiol-dioxygenase n=1 Tax=Oryzibacter oryziterrae TaxID=2766474 RepID=UPI001F21593D|nr:4,5-DOPA dioxygenase extradiol [Oryzibacter oryziterrae]